MGDIGRKFKANVNSLYDLDLEVVSQAERECVQLINENWSDNPFYVFLSPLLNPHICECEIKTHIVNKTKHLSLIGHTVNIYKSKLVSESVLKTLQFVSANFFSHHPDYGLDSICL